MRINEDGNMLGRIAALAVIVVSLVSVARLCGVSQCPLGAGGHCETSSTSRTQP